MPVKSMGDEMRHHDVGDPGITFEGTLRALKIIKEGPGSLHFKYWQRSPYLQEIFKYCDVGEEGAVSRMELFAFMTRSKLEDENDKSADASDTFQIIDSVFGCLKLKNPECADRREFVEGLQQHAAIFETMHSVMPLARVVARFTGNPDNVPESGALAHVLAT